MLDVSGTVYGNWIVWAIHHVSSFLSRFHQMTIWGRWKAINDINITHHFLSTCILFYSWMYCKGLQFTQKIYWQTLPVKRTISFSKPNKTFLGNHTPTFKGFFSLSSLSSFSPEKYDPKYNFIDRFLYLYSISDAKLLVAFAVVNGCTFLVPITELRYSLYYNSDFLTTSSHVCFWFLICF